MKTFFIEANGTPMGEYDGETAADALDAYARDAGYEDYADVVAQFGDDATAIRVDVDALVAAVEKELGTVVQQDSYGSGVALVGSESCATYQDLAQLIGKNCTDFTRAGRPTEMTGGKRVNVYLDAASLASAAALGDGNVSEGIRAALAIAKKPE